MTKRDESEPKRGRHRRVDLEVWLRSPLRRRSLIALAVLVLASLSTLSWGEAMSSFGWTPEWGRLFVSRLLDWSLWGLAFEPIAWFASRTARWISFWPAFVALHAVLSFGIAAGMVEAHRDLTERLYGAPSWSGRFGDRDRGERGSRNERVEQDGAPAAEGAGQDTAIPAADLTDEEREARGQELERRSSSDRPRRSRRGRNPGSRREAGILIYWVIVALGWSARTFVLQRDQERLANGLELRAAVLEGELTTARLAQLESQLHPHFLFNALHSVGGLVRAGEEQMALSTLSALGGLLRATLEHGGAQEVSFGEELELAERYLDVERIRFGDRLETRTDTEPGVASTRVPALVLLPLVENAVQHGIAPRASGGTVELSARIDSDKLVIEVRDDGPGFPSEILDGSAPEGGDGRSHIGLSNTRARLSALYGDTASLVLENRPEGGARVLLTVPARRLDPAEEPTA